MFESGLRTTSYANRVAQGRLFFVSEITHIRAVYRPVRKAVQCSSFRSRWPQVCPGRFC